MHEILPVFSQCLHEIWNIFYWDRTLAVLAKCWLRVTVTSLPGQIIPSQILPFVVRSFHSFSVKLDVWVHFFGFLAQRIRYTHKYRPCFSSWLNCRTILLFCGMILLRTIWPWNKVTGFLDWYTTKYHPVAVDMFCDTWLVLVY